MIDVASVTREAHILVGIYKAALSTDPSTFSNAFVYDALEWCNGFIDSLCKPLLQLNDPPTEEKVNSILRTVATEQGCTGYILDNFLNASELSRRGRQNLLMLLLTNPFVPSVVHAQVMSILIASNKELDPDCLNVLMSGRETCVWINKDPKEVEDVIISRVSELISSFDDERLQAILAALALKSLGSPSCLKIALTVIKNHKGKPSSVDLSQYFIDTICGKDFLPDVLLDLPLFLEVLSSVSTFYAAVEKVFFDKLSDTFRGIVANGCVLPEEGSPESKLVCRLGKCYMVLCSKDSVGTLRMQVERFGSIFKSNLILYKYFEKSILLYTK